jgi:hypothetical protein
MADEQDSDNSEQLKDLEAEGEIRGGVRTGTDGGPIVTDGANKIRSGSGGKGTAGRL